MGAQDVAGNEEEGGPGMDPGYAPGVVVEGLLEVQGARGGEEDGEGEGGVFGGGVELETAGDWRGGCEKRGG